MYLYKRDQTTEQYPYGQITFYVCWGVLQVWVFLVLTLSQDYGLHRHFVYLPTFNTNNFLT